MVRYENLYAGGIAGFNSEEIVNCNYFCDNKNEEYTYSITFLAIKGLGYSSRTAHYYLRGITYNSTKNAGVSTNCISECTTGKVEQKAS